MASKEFTKKEQKIFDAFMYLLFEGKGACGVVRPGMYDIDKHMFAAAVEWYIKRGEDILIEHDEISYLGWANKLQLQSFEYDNYEKYIINNNTAWNIEAILSPEEIENAKNFYEEEKEAREEYNSKEKRRKRATAFTSKKHVRKQVFERDGKVCKLCTKNNDLTLDHIISVFKGGEDHIDNLQVLCRSCNSKKGKH